MGGDGILGFWRFVMQPSVKYCSCNDEKGGIKGANEYITEDVTLHLEPSRFNLRGIRCEFSSSGNISSYLGTFQIQRRYKQHLLVREGSPARPPAYIISRAVVPTNNPYAQKHITVYSTEDARTPPRAAQLNSGPRMKERNRLRHKDDDGNVCFV